MSWTDFLDQRHAMDEAEESWDALRVYPVEALGAMRETTRSVLRSTDRKIRELTERVDALHGIPEDDPRAPQLALDEFDLVVNAAYYRMASVRLVILERLIMDRVDRLLTPEQEPPPYSEIGAEAREEIKREAERRGRRGVTAKVRRRLQLAYDLIGGDSSLLAGGKAELIAALQVEGESGRDPVRQLDVVAGYVGDDAKGDNAARFVLYAEALARLSREE